MSLLAQINNAAHTGAFGHNPRSEPTLAQLAAGNYKKGVVMVKGLSIAIENPAYTYRKGMDKTGQQWMCLMQAHYGYIQGHKGNDGDDMDVFIGVAPENDTVYIVNQKTADGYFDEHKIMLGFLSQQQAVDTYQHCFERGWTGLMSVVPCTMTQFKWWLANGDKSRPVTLDRLPYAGLERLDSVSWGGTDGSNLYSHDGQVHKLLYQIRQCDDTHQALEPLAYHDMIAELGNQGFMYESYDALVVEYNKLEKKAKQLLMAMQSTNWDTPSNTIDAGYGIKQKAKRIEGIVKPVGVTVSKPLTKGGVANVVAWFEMDDGQAVGVFFHNPDKTPKKINPTDEMISYKWVLNKKDITIAVAPEQGKDLIIRTVAKRIMQLVEKNHDRFIKANGDKAELNQAEQDLTAQVAEKQATLKGLQDEVAALQVRKAEKEALEIQVQAEAERLAQEQAAIQTPPLGFVGVWDSKSGQYPFQSITGSKIASFATREEAEKDFKASAIQPQEPVTLTGKELGDFEPIQERPSNWRTNLANARAVAKSLDIETKGKKLANLVDEIDGKDSVPVVAPVAAPTPAAKSTDLTDEEYAVLKKAYDEFKAKTDKIGAAKSREDALKIATDLVTEIPEKEDQIRRAFSDAIRDNKWYGFEINFPKQPVKVKTDAELNSTLKRLQKALEGTAYSVNGKFNYGSAKLKLAYSNGGSSWGRGNKYADKTIDQIKGKFVVIHDVYAKDAIEWMKPLVDGMLSWLNGETVPKMFLGNDLKWDTQIGTPRVIDDAFKEAKAKAAPAAPVTQPNNTLQKDISKSELFKDANVWAIDDFGKENGMVIYSRDEQDGFSIGIVDKLKQVNMQYTDIDTDQQTNESFSTENITNEQVIEKIKMFIAKHEQKSVELLPVQPASEPPMTNPDRDYLQSIIDGEADLSNGDDVEAKLTDISGRLDAELEPMFEQAAEAFAQYAIAQAATV